MLRYFLIKKYRCALFMYRVWFVLVYWIHENRCFTWVDCDSVTQLITHTVENHINTAYVAKLSKENSLLVSHVMLHTGDKPYQCTKCNYAYKEYTQVGNMIIYTVYKPYKCRHSIGHSLIILGKPYQCSQCDKVIWQIIR